MLDQLLATEGVEEACELRSRTGVMAFHGGSLEVMTDVIATAVAEHAGASLYTIRQPRTFRWHIPSTKIDPSHSPALQSFLEHVDKVVAIHGWGTEQFGQITAPSMFRFGRDGIDRPLLVGGRNRELAGRIASALREALPSYEVVDEIEQIPSHCRGLSPRNLCNRVREGGVQLELTPRVRGLPPFWEADQRGPGCPDTQALIEALGNALT